MKISPSAVLALAGVVATSTAFTPFSTPSRASVGVVNVNVDSDALSRRPVSFLKSTETEEAASEPAAETYEYVGCGIPILFFMFAGSHQICFVSTSTSLKMFSDFLEQFFHVAGTLFHFLFR
jgi:hypothetical protein